MSVAEGGMMLFSDNVTHEPEEMPITEQPNEVQSLAYEIKFEEIVENDGAEDMEKDVVAVSKKLETVVLSHDTTGEDSG